VNEVYVCDNGNAYFHSLCLLHNMFYQFNMCLCSNCVLRQNNINISVYVSSIYLCAIDEHAEMCYEVYDPGRTSCFVLYNSSSLLK
jgi:hypothetical protein